VLLVVDGDGDDVSLSVHLQVEGHPIANDQCYRATAVGDTNAAAAATPNPSGTANASADRPRAAFGASDTGTARSTDDVSIWLHALYHGGEGWGFRSELPAWAVADAEGAWEGESVLEAASRVLATSSCHP
jgi:hypothetical protein